MKNLFKNRIALLLNICLLFLFSFGTSLNTFAQQKQIRGVVVDNTGEVVIGATIIVQGDIGKGTVTDNDGKFTLTNIPQNAILEVSYVGMKSILVETNGKTDLNIVLTEDTEILEELVVTALGIKRDEKALGYAVQKVSSEDLSVVKGVNLASNLTGKVAGLFVKNSTELSEKPTIELRGENPLIVIDGVAYGNMSLNDLSSDDIESIDVLKGATASALYGVRGRSGAIMVTTKRGTEGGGIKINVSNNTTVSAGYLKIPKAQASYSTGNYGVLEYNSGYVWGDYMDGREVEQYDPISKSLKVMPLVSKGKDNIVNFLRPSLISNTNFNISQYSEKGGYRVSATQIHQNGQYPNTNLDKFIVSGAGNINFKRLKVESSLSYKKEKAPNLPVANYGNGNILYNMLIWGGTEYDIRDFKDYWKLKDQSQNWGFSAWYDNPYYIMNERIREIDRNILNTNISLTYEFSKSTSLLIRSGYDNYINSEENRRSIGDSGERRGYYGFNQYSGSSFNNDIILSGQYKISNIDIEAIAGASSYWYEDISFLSNTRGGLSVPGFYSLNASVERPNVSKSISRKALYGAYGKIGISWKSGIFVDVTGRNDWSSTLPSDSRSYFYPSVSGSFLPTSFYNPISDVLDYFKIRSSWTIAKKDLGVFEINRLFNVNTDVWDGLSTATYPTTLRDDKIKPETERSFEFGTDLRFFGNRLGLDFTYFNRLRYDRLIRASISEFSGARSILTNTQEELLQKGMEFTLHGKPITNKKFEWTSTLNASFWHWYYQKLDPRYSSQDPRIKAGERYDKYFITDWVRDNNGDIVHQAGNPVKNKYQSVMGHKDPKLMLGFTNRFKFNNFEVNISFDGRIGGLLYSWTEQALWHSGAHPDSDNEWRYDEVVNGKQSYIGPGSKVVSGEALFDPYGALISDTRVFAKNDVPVSYQSYTTIYNENPWDHDAKQNIKDATFIKLRELAFNYHLPKNIANTLLMDDIRVGIIGQNLLLWTKEFRFSDPDRGLENLNSPSTRYVGFNINITL